MIGFYKISEFRGSKDVAGANTQALVTSEMDPNIKAIVYLPPYARKTQSNISIGSIVLAVVDDVTGIGAVLFGKDDADFQYFFDANIEIKKRLDVQNDIKSISGDVIATTISLQNHIHLVSSVTAADAAAIVAAATSGTVATTAMMTGAPQ